jgi:general secretion pathway protein J
MTRKAYSDDGFTLVELLVSLSLISMAALLIAQGLMVDRKALRSLQKHTSDGESVAASQDFIRSRLQALYAEAQFNGDSVGVDMKGTASDLEFLADAPSPDGGIGRYRLYLTPEGRLQVSDRPDQGPKTDPTTVSLLQGVQRIQIEYYGALGPHVRGWTSQWNGGAGVPELVRIRLAFDPHDQRLWPELIVRPAATVDTACVLSADTGLCTGRPTT